MKRKIKFNHSEYYRLQQPVLFALLNGLSQAQGYWGEVLVMDVHDASILSCEVLEEYKGKSDGFVFHSSRVKNVNSIGIETEEGKDYVLAKGLGWLPLEVIMPAVSYLAFIECGYHPSDIMEWDDGSASLEEVFVEGLYKPLINAVTQLCPDTIDQLLYFMSNIGLIPQYPNKAPSNLQEIMQNQLPSYLVLDWLNQVALGKGFVKNNPTDNGEPDCFVVRPESVQVLKDVLKKIGNAYMSKATDIKDNNISGYTYVTEQNDDRSRHICLLGYFPDEAPKYGILVWLQRREQLEDAVHIDWPELGDYAAIVCENVVSYLMDTPNK